MWLEFLLFILFILFAFDFHARRGYLQKAQNIPLVSRLPFVGTLLVLSSFQPDNLHGKFQEFTERYGRSFAALLFGRFVVVTSDPRYVEDILSSSKHIHKHRLYLLLRSWLGDGLLLSHSRKWQTMRKIITPTFHFKVLEQFVQVFDRQSTILVEKLKGFADGQTTVNIYPHMGLLTLDVIAETAMGVCVNAQLDASSEFVQAVNDVTNILATRFVRPHLAFPSFFRLLTPELHRKQLNGITKMHRFTEHIIEQRHKVLTETANNCKLNANEDLGIKTHKALLDVLLQSTTSDGNPLTDAEIRDEVNTFMFEGHDTTTSAASVCLFLLSRHPDIQRKLFDEIRSHFGDELGKSISYNDLNSLYYLSCVIKEALRLFPPIPAIGRYLNEDLKLVDTLLPADTNVIVLLWQILRDPETFPEPARFWPERHLEENIVGNGRASAFSNIPFSAGPRNCIGQRFALLEIKMIIVKMLRHYELLNLGPDIQPSIKIVLRSKTGINFGLKPRVYMHINEK